MFHLSRKSYATVLALFFLLFGNNACKDDYNSVVPYVYVNFPFPPTNYIELNIPGGSVYFPNKGFGGIIVVNNWGDDTTPYLAFDAACTFEVSSLVRVAVLENGSGIATCPKCGSQFMIYGGNGNPIKGPAAEPLKQYHCITSNGQIIVSN
jgi:nitrite reductase/ring-hydroxylating ferredoxin subunit